MCKVVLVILFTTKRTIQQHSTIVIFHCCFSLKNTSSNGLKILWKLTNHMYLRKCLQLFREWACTFVTYSSNVTSIGSTARQHSHSRSLSLSHVHNKNKYILRLKMYYFLYITNFLRGQYIQLNMVLHFLNNQNT